MKPQGELGDANPHGMRVFERERTASKVHHSMVISVQEWAHQVGNSAWQRHMIRVRVNGTE